MIYNVWLDTQLVSFNYFNLGGNRKKTKCEGKRNAYNADISTMRTSLQLQLILFTYHAIFGAKKIPK